MKVRDLLSSNKEFKRFKVLAGEKGLDRGQQFGRGFEIGELVII